MAHTNTEEITPAIDPKILAVEEAIAATGISLQSAVTQGTKDITTSRQLSDQIVEGMNAQTVNTQTVERTKQNAELQEQNANIALLEATGGVAAQAANMLELNEQNADVDRMQKDLVAHMTQDRGTGVLLDSLRNAFSGGFRKQRDLDFARKLRDQTIGEINSETAATESFARVNSLTKKTLNEDAIEANLANIALENKVASNKQAIQNIHSNAQLLGNLTNMSQQQVANEMSRVKLANTAERMELARATHKIQLQRLEIEEKLLPIRLDQAQVTLDQSSLNLDESKEISPSKRAAIVARNLKAASDIAELERLQGQRNEAVQVAESAAGATISTPEEINAAFAPGATPVQRERAQLLRAIGASALINPNTPIATTPAGAANNLTLIAAGGELKQTKYTRVLDQLKLKQQQINTEALSKGAGPKNKAEADAQFNATVKSEMDQLQANIATGTGNPYAAPPMETMHDLMAGKGNILYDRVLKDVGLKEVDGQHIMDLALAGVSAGTISIEEAAMGIDGFFTAAAVYNNTIEGGFERLALPIQEEYNTIVEDPLLPEIDLAGDVGLFGTVLGALGTAAKREFFDVPKKLVDLMDETVVQQQLVKMMQSARISQNITTGTPNNPAPKIIRVEPGQAPGENNAN